MRGLFPAAILAGILLFPSASLAQHRPIDYVNPLVGSDGHGHTFPGPQVPFGMVQLSPDTRTDTWDGSSGYHYSDKRILGFSHTHLNGTGVGCMGDIMLMPTLKKLNSQGEYSSAFSHRNELAKPGYYRVFLDDPKVTAELTATPRVGFHRYTFPTASQAWIAIDLLHGISNDPKDTSVKVVDGSTLTGYRKSGGWGGDRTVYFAIQFSRPFERIIIEEDGIRYGDQKEGKGKVRAYTAFTTKQGDQIEVKVGISSTGVEGALKNLHQETPGWDFDAVRTAAEKQWSDVLAPIQVQSKNSHVLRTFYTNTYLSYLAPSLFNDADGAYYGMDHRVHRDAKFQNYTTFSLWDTFRALHPLLTLSQPSRVKDLTSSLLAEYQESGLKTSPIWPLCGNETWCMIGYHSVPVLVDAYFKGILGPDAERTYRAMRDTAMQNYNGLMSYRELGYTASTPGAQATSKTLETTVDDWCIAQMASALGHKEDAALFLKRSTNYRNLWDGTTRFFRGRKATGKWRAPFDTRGLVGDEYTEADAWQYAFTVQHDVPGMISLLGGDQKFLARMDEMFSLDTVIHTDIPDITGRIGQYAQGNEQCHHQAYLFNYAGAPWKTQKRVRQIMGAFYNDTQTGQVGNNDCGQMSAWYVFSALGFYPVNPANGVYVIGSPLVDRAVLTAPGGKKFVVEAVGNGPKNVYIQSASLNGRSLTQSYITHRQILAGGTLRLVMGPKPNKKWGTSRASRPPATMPVGYKYGPLPTPSSDKPVTLSLPIRVISGEDDEFDGFVGDPNMLEGSAARSDHRIDTSVPNAAPARVYMSERYGSDFSHRFTVPAGSYTVRLHFAELFDEEPHMRIENVSINGVRVLSDFEIIVAAGGINKAVVREFTGVVPKNGKIVIRIQATPGSPDQNAKISGIEILKS